MNTPPKYPAPPAELTARRLLTLSLGGAAIWLSGALAAICALT